MLSPKEDKDGDGQATRGANSQDIQSCPGQATANGNGVYHMSNNFSEDLEVAQVNRGAIGEGAVGGLSTLSEEMSRSLVMEPNDDVKLVTSEPVDRGVDQHSMGSDAHQNVEPGAFSEGSRPTQINFNSTSERKPPVQSGDPSDAGLIYIREQNEQAASNGGDDVRPRKAKQQRNQQPAALRSEQFDDYGDGSPSAGAERPAKQKNRAANNASNRQSRNGSVLSSRDMLRTDEGARTH